jgi:hypothetical protein
VAQNGRASSHIKFLVYDERRSIDHRGVHGPADVLLLPRCVLHYAPYERPGRVREYYYHGFQVFRVADTTPRDGFRRIYNHRSA